MEQAIGCRIITEIERPDRELVDAFKGIPSSNIGDNLNRLYNMRDYLYPLNDHPLLGTAITVKAPMGDNLMLHLAMDYARPGDIIVVDGEHCLGRSLMGEMMIHYAIERGIAGFIVDGAVRDVDAMINAPIPIYTAGVTPEGPYKNGPGEVNVPIACGGQVVFPGDILVGDKDGIVVIRPEYARELAEVSLKKHASEENRLKEAMEKGVSSAPGHYDKFRRIADKIGVQFI